MSDSELYTLSATALWELLATHAVAVAPVTLTAVRDQALFNTLLTLGSAAHASKAARAFLSSSYEAELGHILAACQKRAGAGGGSSSSPLGRHIAEVATDVAKVVGLLDLVPVPEEDAL
jgi:hypothetical protein